MSGGRVLLVRVGAMGDVLHALFAASALRQARPDWQIDWVVDERWRPLLQAQGTAPVIDNTVPVPVRAWKQSPFSLSTLHSFLGLRTLRRERYDPVVDLQGTLRSAAITRLAGAQARWGWENPREAPARFLYSHVAERQGMHIVEQMTALLGQGCEATLLQVLQTELPVDPEAAHWAEIATSAAPRIALLAPAAGWGAKQWPAERFGDLALELARAGFTPFINAISADDPIARGVQRAASDVARVVACEVKQLIALTRRAALVVGGDSGPVHLAAALRVPVVALFGPTDPARNGPWGAGPIRVLRHPTSTTSHTRVAAVEPGLARLTVCQVLEAALAVTADSYRTSALI